MHGAEERHRAFGWRQARLEKAFETVGSRFVEHEGRIDVAHGERMAVPVA